MELTWKGYVIAVRVPVLVVRRPADSLPEPTARESRGLAGLEERRHEREGEYILACGSRHVGPSM